MHTIQRVGSAYFARTAIVVGDVTLGADCNVWHYCVIRGDVAPIRLGSRVNVQDGAVLHCNHGVPLDIGDDVVIGHQGVVHGRRVGSRTLIGIRATVLDDCEIGEDCIIAAGTLLPPRTIVPAGSVVMGLPGKVVRLIRDQERAYIRQVVEEYVRLARQHAEGVYPPYAATSSNGKSPTPDQR